MALAALAGTLREGLDRRAGRWARRRQGADAAPVTLASRRIYILPTGIGLTYAFAVFAMLLGAMNYNNNMGFALTFLLAALGLVAMHHAHRNLAGLQVSLAGAPSVFAGQPARFRIALANPSAGPRYEIVAYVGDERSAPADAAPGGSAVLCLPVATERRGRLRLARFGIRTTHPFALFRAWAWLHLDPECLVWPQPAAQAPAPPSTTAVHGRRDTRRSGDEDFAGLRDFQAGDPPRHVAWKTYARSHTLATKQFAGADTSPLWLRYADAPGDGIEARLSVLTRWVVEAERAGRSYGLALPGARIAPAGGVEHRARCLDALALHGLGEDDVTLV